MSVKVVSPTDPGQPELPMSLLPQPAPAGTQRGQSRQCLAPGAEPRRRPAAVDSRQPQLPIPLCTSASAAAEVGQAGAADSLGAPGSVAADAERPRPADSGQSELPLPVPVIPEQARPADAGAGSRSGLPADAGLGRSAPPTPADPEQSRPAESGQLELPASEQSRQQAAPAAGPDRSATVAGSSSARPVVSSPLTAGIGSDLPIPEAPIPAAVEGSPELPMALRPPGADSDQSQLPMSLRPPASPAAAGLLAQARRGLAEAVQESRPAERFIGAYLAALRGAAAVLAARGRPHRGRARPASTWVLLDSVAPELREWSAFFASNSATRAAAQAGITGKVTVESAAGLVGAATPFLELVRRLVHGLPITGEAHVA